MKEVEVKYIESALTIEKQVALLLSKGLQADQGQLAERLRSVSYHRLSGYWHTFRNIDPKSGDWSFHPGTNFSVIWDDYVFDRQLRLLVFDAIERIEVAIRDDLILTLAVEQGPFGYLDPANLPNIEAVNNVGDTVYTHKELVAYARSLCKREMRNSNPAVIRFHDRYSDEHGDDLPYWILLEIVEFGTLCRFVWGAPTDIKKRIAKRYRLRTIDVMDSWMGALRSARNAVAHHSRYWNRKNPVKPKIPNTKNPEWHVPVDIEPVKDRTFGVLTILKYMMNYIAPQSGWAMRLEALFATHPNIDRRMLGYPDNWQDCPIWQTDMPTTETFEKP
jgi:abortive infection bacteriophage resistance protein